VLLASRKASSAASSIRSLFESTVMLGIYAKALEERRFRLTGKTSIADSPASDPATNFDGSPKCLLAKQGKRRM